MVKAVGVSGIIAFIMLLAALATGAEAEKEKSPLPYTIFDSPRHPALDAMARRNCETQARLNRQGHHDWDRRYRELAATMGPGKYAEICAESWPWQAGESETALWAEMFKCWKQSPGHWSVAKGRHRLSA